MDPLRPATTLAIGAALSRYGEQAVLSHRTAAQAWGLPLLGDAAQDRRIHLTIPRSQRDLRVAGTRVHRTVLPLRDRVTLGDLPVTSLVRTVLDLARELPLPEAVCVADAAIRERRLDVGLLRERAGDVRGPGSAKLRRVVEWADDRCDSVFESLARVALLEAKLGPVASQFRLPDKAHPYDLALEWAHLLIECDSREHHSDPEVLDRDLVFGNDVAPTRWRLLRVRWEHVWPSPTPFLALVRAAVLAGRGPRVRQRRRRELLRLQAGDTRPPPSVRDWPVVRSAGAAQPSRDVTEA